MATKSTKFDIKSEAVRPFYASVGVTDLAVEAVREYAADVQAKVRGYQANVQKNVSELDLQPKALREQAVTLVDENVAALGETYTDLVKRGESLVGRIRRQKSTQDAVKSAETTKAKAKTTRTQATKSAKATKKAATSAAKRTTATAKKRSTAPVSSAKATTTAAKKTATAATKAVADAAQKVGD